MNCGLALLNFLLPNIFHSGQGFDEWFQTGKTTEELAENEESGESTKELAQSEESEKATKELAQISEILPASEPPKVPQERQEEIIVKFRQLLEPFLLRRLKIEVENALLPKKEVYLYVGMTALQKRWYQTILQKDISALNGVGLAKGETKTRNTPF